MSADERQGADKKLIAEEAVVDAMAKAYRNHEPNRYSVRCLHHSCDFVVPSGEHGRARFLFPAHQAEMALAAALGVTLDAECETCGGTGTVEVGGDEWSRTIDTEPCPGCSGGRVPGESALVALLVERGVLEPVGYRHIRVGDLSEFGKWDYVRPESHELVYRVVSPEEPKP